MALRCLLTPCYFIVERRGATMESTDRVRWISSARLLTTLQIPTVTDLMSHNRMQASLWLHRVCAVPEILATASRLICLAAHRFRISQLGINRCHNNQPLLPNPLAGMLYGKNWRANQMIMSLKIVLYHAPWDYLTLQRFKRQRKYCPPPLILITGERLIGIASLWLGRTGNPPSGGLA